MAGFVDGNEKLRPCADADDCRKGWNLVTQGVVNRLFQPTDVSSTVLRRKSRNRMGHAAVQDDGLRFEYRGDEVRHPRCPLSGPQSPSTAPVCAACRHSPITVRLRNRSSSSATLLDDSLSSSADGALGSTPQLDSFGVLARDAQAQPEPSRVLESWPHECCHREQWPWPTI